MYNDDHQVNSSCSSGMMWDLTRSRYQNVVGTSTKIYIKLM